MLRRLVIGALAATAVSMTVPTTAPAIVTPTTTTTTAPLVFVAPTTTSTGTTTSPQIAAPTTSSTTTTTSPVIATPTTITTTTSPVIATPTTTTPVVVVPTTTEPASGDLAQQVAQEDPADVPIGEIDTSGAIPDGLDVTAFPGVGGAPAPPAGDGPTFAAGFTCAYQCIESGVAYPRGFGALLMVETHVPARLFISVLDDNDDVVGATNSTGMVSEFSWALDHLDPGRTYFAMVAATDDNDDTAYAYGSFVTLAQRTVTISIGNPTVTGGPTNIVDTDVWLKVADLNFRSIAPPESLVYLSLPRHLDLALKMLRRWETSQFTSCEGFGADTAPPQGDNDDICGTWNTAMLADIDLDAIPAGRSHWIEHSISTTLQTPSGDGVLPPGYGEPRYFDFSAAVTLSVEYG